MIYHELWGKHLRLGNFLFKYAWSIVMKEKFGKNTAYPDNYYLWQHLETKPKFIDGDYWTDGMLRPRMWEWTPEEEQYVNEFIQNTPNLEVALNFFFQSEKWFENYKDEVYDSLRFKLEELNGLLNSGRYARIFDKPTIGIGVRLGDFVGHGDFYQIPLKWYLNALYSNFNPEDYNVVIFSDDIAKAKKIFWGHNLLFAEPNGTHTHADNFKHYHGDASEQFILGTMMDHWIIGNSTFSWWQAWLAAYRRKDSKVVHSGKVFSETGRMKDIDTTYYYPDWWTKFEIQ